MQGLKIGQVLLSLLFPPRCAVCDALLEPEDLRRVGGSGEVSGYVHRACEKKLYPVAEPVCMHCGRPLDADTQEYCRDCGRALARSEKPLWDGRMPSYIRQGRAVFLYEGQVKKTMYRFKYGNRREYAAFLADAACSKWGGWMRQRGIEAVIPVPMYKRKERKRGYNQAALFGRELAGRMGFAFVPDAVRRVRDTTPQKELNGLERENNLKNAFQTADFVVQYSCILLVDDIYTTGSTAEAVAEELYGAGIQEIYFLAACIGKGY